MRRVLGVVLVGLFLSLLNCPLVWAQATAQISGTARDQSGAVLPGVEIHVTQTDTGVVRDAVTNETGSYVLTNLPIGPYRLEGSLPGFRTYTQSGIVLQVNGSPSINVVLEVGQVSEQVEVQANAALVETRSAGVGSVVENQRILELPLNGRAMIELVALAGAATPAPLINGANRDPFAKGNVSVAGGLNSGLAYTLDGATHNNAQHNGYLSLPFPDALQEFKVETGATGAQNGGKSAGTVSLVTKSGTNEFHGDLFEFVRNGMFNARNAFASKRDTIKRNQFGGTVGGPITQNKLFFFAGYQGTTARQDPSDQFAFVPTPATLAGDFTSFASPACNAGRQIALRAPFVNNRVDPAFFSRPSVILASKLPQATDPCGTTIYSIPNRENDHQAIGRIDYQWTSNHSVFGRYLIDSAVIPPGYDINKNLLAVAGNAGAGADGLSQAFTLGDTYLFSSNVVNAFRLTANRFANVKTAAHLDEAGVGLGDIGVKMYSYQPHSPVATVTGAFTIATLAGPNTAVTFAGSDDLSVLRGNHQLAVGGQLSLWWYTLFADTYNHGRMAFNGQTTGLGLADFLLGNVSQFEMGSNTGHSKKGTYAAVYSADVWKVRPKLTMSYGLRWEPFLPMINLDGSGVHFDQTALRQGVKSTRFANTPPGVFFNGDPQFLTGRQVMNNHWWNFSPRLGLAWDVTGDGRTSVRASVGTFYDYPTAQYQNSLSNSPPFNTRIIVNDVKYENPWGNYPGGDPFPMESGKSVSRNAIWPIYGLVAALDYDTPNMQVAQWNLSVQKQVSTSWLISASYLGSNTTHLWSIQHYNPAVFLGLGPCTLNGVNYPTCSTTANTNLRRRLSLENAATGQYFGFVDRIDSGGTANYNGLLLSIQRRVNSGISFSGNYTWSHCISDPWQVSNADIGSGGWSNPHNRRFDRGNCTAGATDRRHIVNVSAVMDTPKFSSPTLNVLASGWRFSPIFKILSGDYMSVTTNQDRALTGTNGQHASQVLENPYGDKSTKNYLNPAAFALPAMGTFGNAGTGAIEGPGTWQFDVALSRTFQVRESGKLEFRAEAFNVTNAFRMEDPTVNVNSNIFGQITAAKDPRIMQFALKYVF